jgi:uncharacterized protein YneF (UPF0154 family)
LIETSSTIIDGDVLLAVVALLIGFFGSYLVARRKPGERLRACVTLIS